MVSVSVSDLEGVVCMRVPWNCALRSHQVAWTLEEPACGIDTYTKDPIDVATMCVRASVRVCEIECRCLLRLRILWP